MKKNGGISLNFNHRAFGISMYTFVKPEPRSSFQQFCKARRGAFRISIADGVYLPARHFSQHGREIERVGVAADNSLAIVWLINTVRSYMSHAGFAITFEHKTLPTHNSFFQNYRSVFARAVKFSPSFYRAS